MMISLFQDLQHIMYENEKTENNEIEVETKKKTENKNKEEKITINTKTKEKHPKRCGSKSELMEVKGIFQLI